MKFNWGTGIFIFITLFLLACAAFIIFALKQDVNLVHKDYYEKGVDHSEQMKILERSASFSDALKIINLEQYLLIEIEESLSSVIDSGKAILYRPSDRKKDQFLPLEKESTKIVFPKNSLISGRYILKLHWYSDGKKYELHRTISVQ